MTSPFIAGLGGQELILILLVLLLLFGATKLPELARGTGRALRIFKAETKGLIDEDEVEDDKKPGVPPRQIPSARVDDPAADSPQTHDLSDVERERLRRGDQG